MTVLDCVRCGYPHENGDWKYRTWETEAGSVTGWGCVEMGVIKYPEFVPKSVKEDRVKYAGDMVQSHRGGQFSREYAELYPERTKQMLKDGALSIKDVEKSSYVWGKDMKGWDTNKKSDVSAVVGAHKKATKTGKMIHSVKK